MCSVGCGFQARRTTTQCEREEEEGLAFMNVEKVMITTVAFFLPVHGYCLLVFKPDRDFGSWKEDVCDWFGGQRSGERI